MGKIFSVIILVSFILIAIWFRHGNIMARGESGIPFYDPHLQFQINGWAWASYTLGHPTNISVSSAPTYYLLSILKQAGLPEFLSQAFFFWLVLVASGTGIYLLAVEFFPALQARLIILAIFFYWFNPFVLVNIWNRFLNNFFVFYSFLPIALWLFIKGLNSKKYIFSIILGLLSVIFSYAFTSMAFILLFWLLIGYATLFAIIFKDSNFRERLFTLKFFLLTLFFWVLVNFWWLNQVVSYLTLGSFSTVAGSSFVAENNYQTFAALSERLGNVLDILRLRHGTFFSDPQLPWIEIYNLLPVVIFEFAILFLIVTSTVLGRRNLGVLFFGGLFIFSAFLAKGNNPPFGEVVDNIFWRVPLLQLFRNPFEKFGFLLILSAAFLFIFGLHIVLERLKGRWGKLVYSIVIIFLITWAFPFWTGLVFTSDETPTNDLNVGYQVKVPDFYRQARDWIRAQNEDFRLIALPIGGEGITYKWDKGYSGVELSNQLLPLTSISFATNIPFYEKVSKKIEEIFLSNQDLIKVMDALNVRYMMERRDIDWQARKMRDPNSIHSEILEKEKAGQLKKAAEFGELSFWEHPHWQNKKVNVANKIVLASPESDISDLQILNYPSVVLPKKTSAGKINDLITGEIIHPQARFTLAHKPLPVFGIRQDLFPHVNVLPSSPIYQLILVKDMLEINSTRNLEALLRQRLINLGKRLVEAKLESDRKNMVGIMRAVERYNKLLDPTLKQYKGVRSVHEKIITQEELYSIFFQHLSVLENIKQTFQNDEIKNFLGNTEENIKQKLISFDIFPSFGFKEGENFPIKSRVLYQFNVNSEGDFELIWGKQLLNNFYKIKEGDELLLQINDKVIPKKVFTNKQGYVSFGKIRLSPGIHTIGLNTPDGKNLILSQPEINFKADHGEQILRLPIQNLDSRSTYSLSFDYWIKKGSGIKVLLEGNNSPVKNGVVVPSFSEIIGPNFYDFTPKNFFSGLEISEGADSTTLIFKVEPRNDCETIFYSRNRTRCKDKDFRKAYDKTTEVSVSNISVTRNLDDRPLLIRIGLDDDKVSLPAVSFNRINPTEYQLSVKDAKVPFILIFSELFDPGWEILSRQDKRETFEHFPVNSFANGWFVDRTGNLDFSIKYAPQKLLDLGEKISSISLAVGGLIVIGSILSRRFKGKKV